MNSGEPRERVLRASLALACALGLLILGAARVTDAQGRARPGFPLPRFSARTLGGGSFSTDALANRRAVLYLFSSRDPDADRFAGLVERMGSDLEAANVQRIGIARDPQPERAREFAARHHFGFPILEDANLSVSRKLNAPAGKSALYLVDGEGWIFGGFAGLDVQIDDPIAYYERSLRESLHIEKPGESVEPSLGVLPPAPDFRVRSLAGSEISLADLAGQAAVLVFFLPTCPHCHELLRFLEGLHERLAATPFRVVAISIQNHRYVMEDMRSKLGLTFPLYVDPDATVQRAYAFNASVPDTLVLDRQGRVFARHVGAEPRIEALLTMEIRHVLGVENPILLDRKGYSGAEACRICHTREHDTWTLTQHSYAFETLAEHAEDRNPECLRCHTVGFGKEGGYSLDTPFPYLEGVQCENCHGRGGPHQSPGFASQGYERVCRGCHDETHSLRFKFAERLPLVSHTANEQFASLSLEEREKLLARRSKRQLKMFDPGRFVGSERCQSCHVPQYEKWQKSAHSHAFETLAKSGDRANDRCLACHTTGFQKTGGFPEGGPALRQVGCESCHGPGGDHVAEGSRKKGTMLYLSDKCDTCVILQICGSCHDDQNDPRFEFELDEKLRATAHGGIKDFSK